MQTKIAFISDIHGNSPALQAVLDDIHREQCTKIFMLGDIINGMDPHGCIQILCEWSDKNNVEIAGIKGNAEAYLVTPDRDVLIQQSDNWDADLLKLLQWWQDHMSATDMEWVQTLPDTLQVEDILLVHDSPMDRKAVHSQLDIPPQYRELKFHGKGITPEMPNLEWQKLTEYMRSANITHVLCGHTHRPLIREIDELLICNIGSAGMPLDGDPRPSWAMLEKDTHGHRKISIRRVDYNVAAIHEIIDNTPGYYDFQMAGFKEAYKKMFLHGKYWRNFMPDDILE